MKIFVVSMHVDGDVFPKYYCETKEMAENYIKKTKNPHCYKIQTVRLELKEKV